jgi:hypothetical protein
MTSASGLVCSGARPTDAPGARMCRPTERTYDCRRATRGSAEQIFGSAGGRSGRLCHQPQNDPHPRAPRSAALIQSTKGAGVSPSEHFNGGVTVGAACRSASRSVPRGTALPRRWASQLRATSNGGLGSPCGGGEYPRPRIRWTSSRDGRTSCEPVHAQVLASGWADQLALIEQDPGARSPPWEARPSPPRTTAGRPNGPLAS